MLVTLTPGAGERLSVQCDIANELLEKGIVSEVQLQFNDGLKFMRTYHSEEEIKKFIYPDYETEYDYDVRMELYFKEKGLR